MFPRAGSYQYEKDRYEIKRTNEQHWHMMSELNNVYIVIMYIHSGHEWRLQYKCSPTGIANDWQTAGNKKKIILFAVLPFVCHFKK